MYIRTSSDECLICEESLLIGISLYSILTQDKLCFKCRSTLSSKIMKTSFNNFPLYSFYAYEKSSQLLIRYKDYRDTSLAPIFLSPYIFFINKFLKDYTVVLIPSSRKMLEYRGFNHLLLMLEYCDLEIVDCFEKSDEVQRFSKSRHVKFSMTKELCFDKVLIFDDVITSGNSMLAMINLLKPISNKIVLMAVINNISEVK